jgi:iron complex outermembrane receptor protein
MNQAILKGKLLFLISIWPTLFYAQTSDTLQYTMDTLRVEAVRASVSSADAPLSLSIKTRTSRELASDAAGSITSLTQDLPGIWVNDRQNRALGERITIRGIGWRAQFGVRGIQVVLDGIPLTVADGQSVTNIIDPAFIKRVELIRGPAASYWGNSSGGVLYLSTKASQPTGNSFNARTYAGSYGGRKAEFRLNNSSGDHSVSAFTSYDASDGYRDYSASRLLRSGVQGNYTFNDNSRLQYTGALQWMPQAEHPSGLTAEQAAGSPQGANPSFVDSDAGKQVTQGQLGLSYSRETGFGLLSASTYGSYRDLTNPLPFGIITVDRLAGGMRTSLEKDFKKLNLNMGGELKFQRDDREEFENSNGRRGATTVNQTETVGNQALFLTSTYTAGPLKLLSSLRYDRITFASDTTAGPQTRQRSFQSVSPGLGLSYSFGASTLYSNLSTSFQAPTTTELVNRPDGGSGFNPELKPEQTIGLEAGSRGSLGGGILEYDAALYRLWIQDLLFPYQLEANGATFFRNQGETRHQGVEVAATLRAAENLSVQGTYTLTDADFVDAQTLDSLSLKGKTVPGIAKHRLSGNISWSPAPVWMQLSARYTGAYPVNNVNTTRNGGYIVADAKFSYEWNFQQSGVTLTPFININNMLNKRYNGSVVVNAFGGRYFEPAPGRNWQAGVSIRF